MRTITRKTNVRRHDRNTKHKVADVRNHLRKVVRPVLGTVEIKNLTYKQAKRRFPTLAPYGDIDQDGIINKRDCRPFDETRQDEEKHYCVGCGRETNAFYSPLIGWYCGDCKGIWERARKEREEIQERKKKKVPINYEGFEDTNDTTEKYWGNY